MKASSSYNILRTFEDNEGNSGIKVSSNLSAKELVTEVESDCTFNKFLEYSDYLLDFFFMFLNKISQLQ
jgi:hypothetical protein